MSQNITGIRKDYRLKILLETDVSDNPFDQFGVWWQEAVNSRIEDVNAMTLATCSALGMPSARIVLLKEYSRHGFTFFTNYDSKKGRDLAENKNVALVFFWKELERQIRIEGVAEKVSDEISSGYFNIRPPASRIGAWSSPQSAVIKDRHILEINEATYKTTFADGNIPRPPHWGGYIVIPVKLEFWQGRASRLHDRIQYRLQDDKWIIERLAP